AGLRWHGCGLCLAVLAHGDPVGADCRPCAEQCRGPGGAWPGLSPIDEKLSPGRPQFTPQQGKGRIMKRWILAAATVVVLAGCATTTSPTGRKQYMAYSDSQLNQMGAQAFTEMKAGQKTVSGGQQNAYVQCVVRALVQQLPGDWQK